MRRNCLECHGPAKQEGGLRLDDGPAALVGGDSGAVIIAGQPAASEILRRVSLPRTDDEAIPPQGKGLARREIDALSGWIAAGAAWPTATADEKHWAYVPPRLPDLPSNTTDNAIDAFVEAAHAREGLAFAPEADRAVLARRVSFDLTGLPPRLDDVAALLADASPDAFERYVDRLLSSEEFAVRWARMWLDLARYADSQGFQRDDLREVWAYGDWVVDALNADMPFDQFTIEQVAGDFLPDATERTRIATGFHRCTPTNVEADYRLAAYFNSTEAEADRANPKVPGSIRFVGPAMPLVADPLAADREEIATHLRQARQARARLQKTAADDPRAIAQADAAKPSACSAWPPRQCFCSSDRSTGRPGTPSRN